MGVRMGAMPLRHPNRQAERERQAWRAIHAAREYLTVAVSSTNVDPFETLRESERIMKRGRRRR